MQNLQIIDIHDSNTSYYVELKSKFTVLTGLSAIGKTALVRMLQMSLNYNPAIVNKSTLPVVIPNPMQGIVGIRNVICVIDETSPLLKTLKASDYNQTDAYFLFIHREQINLPVKIDVDDYLTFALSEDGKQHTTMPLYPRRDLTAMSSNVICEDSNSGAQFIDEVLNLQCIKANGKNNLAVFARKSKLKECTWVYDRAGISYMELRRQLDYADKCNINVVSEIDWNSFEAYILESDEYGYTVENYPNKENNATALFKKLFPKYDKSTLPAGMKMPVYWKIADALRLLQGTDVSSKLMWCREHAPEALRNESDELLLSVMEDAYQKHLRGEL